MIEEFKKRYLEYKERCGKPQWGALYPKKATFDNFFTREERKYLSIYEGAFTINDQNIRQLIKDEESK